MRRTGRDQVRRREKHRGKQSNKETRKSSEEAGKELWKTGKDRGGRRPARPPSRREQETCQQDRGKARRKGDGPRKYRGGAGKKQGRTGRKQQERECTWELLTGRTGEGKNQAGNWQQRQNLRRSGKEWETSGEEAWKKLERNQQELGRARKELGRVGKDQRSELHHATNLLKAVWLHLHAAMHLLFHAFRFSARPGLVQSV